MLAPNAHMRGDGTEVGTQETDGELLGLLGGAIRRCGVPITPADGALGTPDGSWLRRLPCPA